jgi:hypothetical protein
MGPASRILSAFRGNRSRAELVLLALLTALLGVLAWRFASHTATLLAYPYEWDEDEGYHVYLPFAPGASDLESHLGERSCSWPGFSVALG